MMKIVSEFRLGDMRIRYVSDEEGQVGMELYPASMKAELADGKSYRADPLVQWKKEGDAYPFGFANGLTMRNSESVSRMKYKGQQVEEDGAGIQITTTLEDSEGCRISHILSYKKGNPAFTVSAEFENFGDELLTLEMMSSFSLGGITPFAGDEAPGRLVTYRIRSKWSGEGRLEKRTVSELLLEPSWSRHGAYSDKIGQNGSLPVRGYYPFEAVEDVQTNVVWAACLAVPSSWQMELYRRDEALCMSGGIADYDSGHWRREVRPGESFLTVPAFLTVCRENVDDACQRLTKMWKKADDGTELPVIFNEFCTTWGKPSDENISRILKVLEGRPFCYFVIDAGWYADSVKGWESNMGDWEVCEDLFPDGLMATVNKIRNAGFIPGIWFEMETCGKDSKAYWLEDHLLKRHGKVITAGGRRFWDMRDPWTQEYLSGKVIGFLERYGFGYLKVDYNESIGIGCDGAESLGEGLRQNMEAAQEFFRKIRRRLPDLVIEVCASGGHRMEPSMIRLCDMVSFSDAHEEKEIPVIAAQVHRMIPPGQSQIWAVLRAGDSRKRIVYSMANTFLGVMCLSGDVYTLSDSQWNLVDRGIEFYRAVSHIIRDGHTCYHGTKQQSWRFLKGWQGIVRYSDDRREALGVIHRFEGQDEAAGMICLPVGTGYRLERIYEGADHRVRLEEGCLKFEFDEDYDAAAVHLVKD
ncbi:glycoside hydrolase family 36 protein [Diplocloster modestus]|nr:glycoside hydrolase family 36 protein [Diplocloster modestus]